MFPFSFNRIETDPLQVPLKAGEIIFVVGSNGCGKSSLMHNL
jgi:ABC-type siderophore export system fused ATPase/permease subunit